MGEITPDVEALHMIIGLGNFEATGSTGGNTYDLAQRIMSSDWLEAHDRAVAEKAWDDCLDEIEKHELNTDQARQGNPYRKGASE